MAGTLELSRIAALLDPGKAVRIDNLQHDGPDTLCLLAVAA